MQQNKNYVEYKSFDELPEELKEKFKSGAKGSGLVRGRRGYTEFINQLNQRGDELIGDYVGALTKTQVKFGKCGHVAEISPIKYKNGRGCGVCSGSQVQHGINDLGTLQPDLTKEWHPTKNGELTPYNLTQYSHKKVWWQCEKGHEWEAGVYSRAKGKKCPYCSNQKVLKGYNDIATTHPQYIRYFVNFEDAYKYTVGSNKKLKLNCPHCGYVKSMGIYSFIRQGLSCDLCSDGVSYPEKMTASILNKLNVGFVKQMSFDNGKHKYDFYLPKYNAILETHGKQHYEQGFKKFGKTLEEEQDNDRHKRELAISNGIVEEDYHEVDCRYSTLEWCRPNIEQTLSSYTDVSTLTDEDWRQADIEAQKSLKIEVCKYWNENKEVNSELTTQQVADVFGINRVTVGRYLSWGKANGLCSYDAQKERVSNSRRNSKYVHLIKPCGNNWFEDGMSMNELGRITGIGRTTISKYLDRGALKYNHKAKYDPKYIGSRIVSAEVYDNQHQTNQNT